ncbi:MAG: hypothetical protein ABI683_06510 [Ginsengibacter sp.]
MKIVFIFFLSLFFKNGFSQYIVTKVTGIVKNETTKEILKPGSRYAKTDKLTWITPKAIVRTIIPGEGVYIVNQKDEGTGNKILEIVKFTLHLKSKEDNLSGRGDNENLVPANLNTEEDINTKNLITGENKYLFDKTVYNVSDGNRFFLQTEIPGSNTVTKALQTSGDTLLLYNSDFKKNSQADSANTKYKLGFYSKDDNTSKLLAQIQPYFDSTAEMETIMKIMIDGDTKNDKEKMKRQCYLEIYYALGKPSDIIFQDTFDKLYVFSLQNSTGKN